MDHYNYHESFECDYQPDNHEPSKLFPKENLKDKLIENQNTLLPSIEIFEPSIVEKVLPDRIYCSIAIFSTSVDTKQINYQAVIHTFPEF